jgi:2-oxoglutarate dehydrogenase E2 component (dihydrolipoamide succinyltransferase)
MTIELIVPTLGESITEATVSKWLKKIGEPFEVDEPLVEIETDKITVEVPAPSAGIISEIKVKEGKDINIGGVLGIISDIGDNKTVIKKSTNLQENQVTTDLSKENEPLNKASKETISNENNPSKLSPSVKKMIAEHNLDFKSINSQRKDGRITKEDVLNYLQNPVPKSTNAPEREEVVRMSKIRRTIATRLKDSQNTAAILTTFNEVDMSEIIKVREAKKDDFIKRYDVKLGFMSFFVKAVVLSLQEFPAVNWYSCWYRKRTCSPCFKKCR